MPDLGNIARRATRIIAAPLVERGYRPDPSYLFLELNRRCNHRCVMCDIWKIQEDGLPLPEIERIFSEPFYDKLERVILAGGEPTIRRDLADVASFFIDRLPRLRAMAILTNGYNTKNIMFAVNSILDRMDADPRGGHYLAVQIALDGLDEEYNKIRGIHKAWSRTHETIKQLKQLSLERPNLGLMLHVVIQPNNLEHLDEINAFAKNLDISILFSPVVVSDTYFGNADLADSLAFTPVQKERARRFILEQDDSYTDALSFYYKDVAEMLRGAQRSRKCMMGYYIMYVRMDGKVFPCINSGDELLGDLVTQSPEEVWRGKGPEGMRKIVRRDHCPSCASACDNDMTSATELAIKVKEKLFGRAPNTKLIEESTAAIELYQTEESNSSDVIARSRASGD